MKIRKFFKPLKGVLLRRVGLLPFHFLIPVLAVPLIAGVALTQLYNFPIASFRFTKPKPITQSATILPASTQQAIENLASQEIKADNANANLATNNSVSSTSQGGLIQPLIDSIAETFTVNPVDKAKIELRIIDRQIQELAVLIGNDKSDRAVERAVNLIKTIGQETGQVVGSPKAQADREVLTTLIQQYNRLQLVIQKVEDQLPIASYLKIDAARETYLEKGAKDSLNSAPNLDVVNNIGIKEVAKIVGKDFAELKAIEILSDLESGLKPETKVKLNGLEKQLAIQFEKRMLTLAPDVRNRKLQDYIKYSYGNPINQVQSFNRMQEFLTDRDLILSVDSLKEISLKKLEARVLEINTPELEAVFNQKTLSSPQDIKTLIQMKMDIDAGKDEAAKQRIAGLAQRAKQASVPIFGKDKNVLLNAFPTKGVNSDLLDVVLINDVDQVLSSSPKVSADIKQTVREVKQKTLQNFVATVSKEGFLTQSKLAYNPVSSNADVRVLLPAPQAIPILEGIKKQLSDQDQAKMAVVEKAASNILASHLLSQVNDPAIFEQYQQFIASNPQVKQTIQSYVGQNFFTNLNQKKKLIDKQSKADQQKLYEKMQQIVQAIFIAPNGSDLEKQLPTAVQTEINKLKQELPANNVPKLDTPEGIILPEVAKLPDDVNAAIIAAARQEIKDKTESKLAQLDLTVKAKDLGVSEPTILPGNLLYPVIEILREIPVLLATDPIDKAEKQLAIDNVRTLEAAKLLEGSQSQKTVDQALVVLDKINQDFDLLKAHVAELKQEEPAKVDTLVNQIIENGVARQTVLSSIENKVYGDDFVKVEIDRQQVLKNGVDVLLDLTNQDAQKLTQKLEQVVASTTGSDLKDIKAVELLTEIERTQPEPVVQILNKAENVLAQNLETKLLAMPKEQRTEEVLAYAQSAPGNPILQFEAYDTLKKDFKNPETIALTEGLKDKAVENLTEKISEITDAASRGQFVDAVVGGEPQDLKIVTEIETRVAPVATTAITETLPIVEKIADIKAEVEQNIVDRYKDKPQELAKTDFYQSATVSATVDITDVKVAADLAEVLSRTPEVSADVVAVAKQEETKVVDALVENISSPKFQAAQTLNPQPETIAELVALKTQTPPAIDAKIDIAIKAEVNLIEQHLTTQVNDSVTFQGYVAQIVADPVVTQVVQNVGGTQFQQAVDQKSQVIEKQAVSEQTQLATTVSSVQQEIFNAPANNPSAVEQTLPTVVQQKIEEIKQEVPVAQIPPISVPEAPAAQASPPPAAPQPQTQSEPPPAAPGL